MKVLTGIFVVGAMTFMLGCSPSVEAPAPIAAPAPTATAEEPIGEMDFESGEAESPATEETEAEPEGSSEQE